jgi:hypothetical protein
VPDAPAGIGAPRSAAWTALPTRTRQLADVAILLGITGVACAVVAIAASAFPGHGQTIALAGTMAIAVIFTAILVVVLVRRAGKPKFDDLIVLRSPVEPTWIGADGFAVRRGGAAIVTRYEDVSAIVNDVNVDFDDRYRRTTGYRHALRVTDKAGAPILAIHARIPVDPTFDELRDQVPSSHPIHFGMAARQAWEEWRTRNDLPI